MEPNANRIGDVVRQNNVGVIEIGEIGDQPEAERSLGGMGRFALTLGLIDSTESVVVRHVVELSELGFGSR